MGALRSARHIYDLVGWIEDEHLLQDITGGSPDELALLVAACEVIALRRATRSPSAAARWRGTYVCPVLMPCDTSFSGLRLPDPERVDNRHRPRA